MNNNALVCNFCGKAIKRNTAFCASIVYRMFAKDDIQECGDDYTLLSCEKCEGIRMRALKPRPIGVPQTTV